MTVGILPDADAPGPVRIDGVLLPLALTLSIDERRWRASPVAGVRPK